jgi:hypothetical protein
MWRDMFRSAVLLVVETDSYVARYVQVCGAVGRGNRQLCGAICSGLRCDSRTKVVGSLCLAVPSVAACIAPSLYSRSPPCNFAILLQSAVQLRYTPAVHRATSLYTCSPPCNFAVLLQSAVQLHCAPAAP